MGDVPATHGHGGLDHQQSMFGGQQTTLYGGPAYYPPPYNPAQGPYPPPQGYNPGHPQGQMYQGGYGHGYHPQGPQQYPYPGGQRPGSPGVAALGQAASCGSCMACLTCVLCSCSPCIMGAASGGMSDEAGEDGNQVPGTANVSAPHDDAPHNDEH